MEVHRITTNLKGLKRWAWENNPYPNRWYLKPGHENEAIKEVEYYFTRFEIYFKNSK